MTPPDDIAYDAAPPELGGFSEDALVAQPAIDLLVSLGWTHADLWHEQSRPELAQGRAFSRENAPKEWWLPDRLRVAIASLNPDLDEAAHAAAYDEVTRDRSAMHHYAANRELMDLCRDGVPVETNVDGERRKVTARLVDWRHTEKNDFFLGSEVWFASEVYKRRADLVGFVNGLPLLFVELKGVDKPVFHAFDHNLRDYKDTIPRVFDANAFVLLSNGTESRIGASNAPWRYFRAWKREHEDDEGRVSLEVALRAACAPDRLLDMAENFLVFEDGKNGLVKMVAQNHQVLGVNRAYDVVASGEANDGRLGVFWHTQGSGKSLSMLMFARKVLRRLGGKTFVVITDRTELDKQIAETFAETGLLEKRVDAVRAQSRDHLRELLRGNERFVFTLIHKFGTEDGEAHPVLTDRDDVIVMTDEAHRSQYATLAANMRRALPNASFIGFTGTPLMASGEQTREVFGDYVSVYDFARSVEDEATVPLYYENRIPALQLDPAELDEKLGTLLDDADLTEEQEDKLERRLGNKYHLITRPDRLEKIADDVVRHFPARGYRGKAMFVAIDKATALRMQTLVAERWDAEVARLRALPTRSAKDEAKLAFMAETKTALIVSPGQNEVDDLRKQGLDIAPHRKKMNEEDLEARFKADADPLRLVFVCAMWITGFDVPTCSTVYLDKPMRNHTLMQTIARANRTAEDKKAGLIVDYIGIFKKLQDALAIYATPETEGEKPIEEKDALLAELEAAVREAETWAEVRKADLPAILATQGFERQAAFDVARDALSGSDDEVRGFLRRAASAWTLYKATLPDDDALPLAGRVMVLRKLAGMLRKDQGEVDVSAIEAEITGLLDEAVQGAVIEAEIVEGDDLSHLVNLADIDFEALRGLLNGEQTKTRSRQLRAAVEAKLKDMAARNPIRATLVTKFEELVADYNAGNVNADDMLRALIEFLERLRDEDRRGVREHLSEEELAIFDLLTTPGPELTEEERSVVKKVAGDLLTALREGALILDWRLKEQARAAVRTVIKQSLDDLPSAYERAIWETKVQSTYDWVFTRYGQRQ